MIITIQDIRKAFEDSQPPHGDLRPHKSSSDRYYNLVTQAMWLEFQRGVKFIVDFLHEEGIS